MHVTARLVSHASGGCAPVVAVDVRICRLRYGHAPDRPTVTPLAQARTDPDGRVSLSIDGFEGQSLLQMRRKGRFVSLVPGVAGPSDLDFGEVCVHDTSLGTRFGVRQHGLPSHASTSPALAHGDPTVHTFVRPVSLAGVRRFLETPSTTCWPVPADDWLLDAAGVGSPLSWRVRRVEHAHWVDEDVRLTKTSPEDPHPRERNHHRIDLRMRSRRPHTEIQVLIQLPPARDPTLVLRGFGAAEQHALVERFCSEQPPLVAAPPAAHLQPSDFDPPKAKSKKTRRRSAVPASPTPRPPAPPSPPKARARSDDDCPRCAARLDSAVVQTFRDPQTDAWSDDKVWRCPRCHWRQRRPHGDSEGPVPQGHRGDRDLGHTLQAAIRHARSHRTSDRRWRELAQDLEALLDSEHQIEPTLAPPGCPHRRVLTDEEMYLLSRALGDAPGAHRRELRAHWDLTVAEHAQRGWPMPEVRVLVERDRQDATGVPPSRSLP